MRSRSSSRLARWATAGSAALVSLAALIPFAAPAASDEPTPATSPDADWTVGIVKGDQVNLRIGPRQDDVAVLTLEQGAVVIVVERAGEWLGVRLPAGFAGSIAAELTEPVDAEHVRVTGSNVNLRRGSGLDQPPFRDRLVKGVVLPVLAKEGEWLLVEAPEEIRAYVHSRYVEEKGTVAANAERIASGRHRREAREALRIESAKKTAASIDPANPSKPATPAAAGSAGDAGDDDKSLRDEMGAATKGLVALRAAGGYDVAPVAAIEDRLEAAAARWKGASDRTKALAKVLLEDLRREEAIRVAFADEILAKKRTGQPAPTAAKPPAESMDAVELTGVIRWEAAPGWDGGGVFVLWEIGGIAGSRQPVRALHWATGDLKTVATEKDAADVKVKVRGKQTGGRLLGLPTVEVATVERVP
jgi:SH3-like domain-containing protein